MNPVSKFTPRIRREKTNLSDPGDKKDKVQVFCRLRPLSDEEPTCIRLLSASTLALISPESRTLRKECHCTFKHIFTAYSSQNEVFEHVAYPLLEDVLKGQSGLLFTYGVTGSGKTYTLSGDRDHPGIMPKCIHTIFNTLEEFQAPRFVIVPDKQNGFEIQSVDEAQKQEFKFLRTNSSEKLGRSAQKPLKDVTFINDGIKILDVNESNLYSIFVSYVEIYNNTVYDLLDEKYSHEPKLIREDTQRNTFVNGVVEMEVKSAEEAFQHFNMGQRRKRMGNTVLNSVSSRSHSIFNIRIVQFQQMARNDEGCPVIPDSNLLKTAQLTFVDLAGSERTNRTQNTGMLLKEASKINNSLMNLRICMDTLRENQLRGTNKLVPYRDSRLTWLFKNYFEGDGRVEMIVCVNPSIGDYEENIQVMKFAETSQDVRIARNDMTPRYATPLKKTIHKKPVLTPSHATPNVKPKADTNIGPKLPEFKLSIGNFQESLNNLEQLYTIVQIRGQKLQLLDQEITQKEDEFRKEILEVHQAKVLGESSLKSTRAQLRREKQKADNLEKKISELEVAQGVLKMKNDEQNDVIKNLRRTINEKDLKINRNAMEREKSKQKLVLQSEKMTQELDAKLRRQREHLNAAMKAKDHKIQKIKDIVEHDFIPPDAPEITQIEPVTLQQPQTPTSYGPRRNVQATSTPKRHRRSRSAGEVWLEHNAVKPVPLGTVLQPCIKKRKSVTKLSKATDITNPKQSKYCLIAQDQDMNGDLETRVFKGDIVPTCGGGAQVIFNDVERLTQQSPTAEDN